MVFPGVLRGRPGPRLATILTSRPRRSLSSPGMYCSFSVALGESFSRPRASYLHRRRPVDRNGRLIVIIASLRRTPTILAMLAMLAVLGLSISASASAAPTFTFKTEALPIPGFPHTGDILGAGAVIQVEGKISGTEYG